MNTAIPRNDLEGYSPSERPEIINTLEAKAGKKYKEYKNIELKMDYVELKDSLIFAGVPLSLYPNFGNIGRFHDEYKENMMNHYAPYTEVGYSGTFGNGSWDYIFGCQIRSMEDVPEGLISFDIELKRFVEITFRVKTIYELVGDDKGPGDAMVTAGEYIREIWLPEHGDEVNVVDLNNLCFEVKKGDRTYYLGMIEIYKVELQDDAEISFYIPLK